MSNRPDLGPSIRLQSGWSATQPVRAVLVGDRVIVQGRVKNTSGFLMPTGSLGWTMPPDRRPPIQDWWVCAATTPLGEWKNDSVCRVEVHTHGDVLTQAPVDPGVEISVAQINYMMDF